MSCKKVMMDMGAPYSEQELVSFHTISKGALGECGMRGGMLEATNIHPDTIDQLYKIASINLSPNTFGQVLHASSAAQEPWSCGPCDVFSCDSLRTYIMLRCVASFPWHGGLMILQAEMCDLELCQQCLWSRSSRLDLVSGPDETSHSKRICRTSFTSFLPVWNAVP